MKDSIKREQSQAGLSFAERKNFQPKVKRNRLLLLLALLMTAATGAWAQGAKHLITATYDKQTRSLEQPLPYATTVGELYEAVTDEPFSDLISRMTALEMTLSGIGSTNTSVVSVGEFNGASTPVTVNADGKAAVALRFGSYAQGIFVSVTPPLYVTMKDGVKDADKWTVKVGEGQAQALPIGGLKGDGSETVTLQYNGRLKVKGVKATSDAAPAAPSVDLSTLTADYEAQDGEVLTGTLGANVKISIADGATVTLKNLSINASGTWTSGNHAGITCPGNATISLEGTNTVKGFYEDYPGIHIAKGKTLYIKGSGTLTAIGGGYGAGIGGGYDISCGNIEIQDGTVNAQGGRQAAGIGSGVYYSKSSDCGTITISGGTVNATGGVSASGIGSGDKGTCSDITISGGTVNATGGENNSNTGTGAGIGSGRNGTCGNITIANTVTKVTATAGPNAPYSIGKGSLGGSCGTVTIGGTKYWENNAAVNGGDTYLATSPLIYQP